MHSDRIKAESIKSLAMLGGGVVLLVAALWTYPWTVPPEPRAEIGKPLFDLERFTPENVSVMEITRLDESGDRVVRFRVERNAAGIWTIPSSDNYPADAERQMIDAVTSLTPVRVIDVLPDDETGSGSVGTSGKPVDRDQAFGVVEPDPALDADAQQGAGILVSFLDRNRETIASAIIGNRDQNRPELRFVRKPGQPLIYVVEYDPSVLRTDFRDWIDKDLLQIDAVDIARVEIRDYQILPDDADRTKERYQAAILSDGTRWTLESLLEFDEQGNPTEVTLDAGQSLNNVGLNEMAAMLDGLEIVDVARKPAGLGDPRGRLSPEAELSLRQRGFLPRLADGGYEIKSVNGELIFDTRQGVRYVLRFGMIRNSETGGAGTFDRFMMVSTSVNEDLFPVPTPPATAGAGSDTPPPPPGDAPPPPGTDAGPGEDTATTPQDDATSQDEDAQDDEQRRAEAEYRRKLAQRSDAIAQAEEKVRMLNLRFQDWYYVIDEGSFKTIRLERDKLIVTRSLLGTPQDGGN